MKSIKILVITALFFSVTSFKPNQAVPEMKWMGWNDGSALATKKKKIALVDCYTEWCGWCKKMDKDTYSNQQIQNKIAADFVPIKLNPELNQTYLFKGKQYDGKQLLYEITNHAGVTGYPTIIFLIPSGKTTIVEMSVGYSNADQFSEVLDAMKAKRN